MEDLKKYSFYKKKINQNKRLNINILFYEEVNCPFNFIENKYKEFISFFEKYEGLYSEIPTKKTPFFYENYFRDYDYFSYAIIDKYLNVFFNIQKKEILDINKIWMNRKILKKLKNYDLKIERLFNPNFTYKDFKRFNTCNYKYININNLEIFNIHTLKEDKFYFEKGFIKDIS